MKYYSKINFKTFKNFKLIKIMNILICIFIINSDLNLRLFNETRKQLKMSLKSFIPCKFPLNLTNLSPFCIRYHRWRMSNCIRNHCHGQVRRHKWHKYYFAENQAERKDVKNVASWGNYEIEHISSLPLLAKWLWLLERSFIPQRNWRYRYACD